MARAETTLRTARAIVLHAVWTHLVTEPQLRHELNAGARNGSALARRVLDDAVRGAATAPEAEKCDALLDEAGPTIRLLLNPRIVVDGLLVGRTDGWLLGTGLGYESSSREQHGDEEDRAETDARSDRFSAKGLQLLHRSPTRFRRDPAAWACTVLQAAAARQGREPSGLVVVPYGPVLPATPEEMFLFRTGALAGAEAARP